MICIDIGEVNGLNVHWLRWIVCNLQCKVLSPSVSSVSEATQPSSAISWHPLHTPKLKVSGRERNLENSARALGLNRTVAAQPAGREKEDQQMAQHHQNTTHPGDAENRRDTLHVPLI